MPRARARARTSSHVLHVLLLWTLSAGACADDVVSPADTTRNVPSFDEGAPTDGHSPTLSVAIHSCAVRADGGLECWGGTSAQAPAERMAGNGVFTQVSVNGDHACAVTTDGQAECWGTDEDTIVDHAVHGYRKVAAGEGHACAFHWGNVLECWGAPGTDYAPDTILSPGGEFVDVAADYQHTCFIMIDGSLHCRGTAGHTLPEDTLAGFITVSTNDLHTCGVRDNGSIGCIGVMLPGFEAVRNPPSGLFYSQVSVGVQHACALLSDGSLECWGVDYEGRTTPPDTGTWIAVAAGTDHSCALHENEVVVCWGEASRLVTPPAAPTDLSAVWRDSLGVVELAWTDNSVEREFRVERRADGDSAWSLLVATAAGATAYSDTTVALNETYAYRVQACGIRGCSAHGDSVEIVPAVLPDAPTGLGASAAGNVVTVSWTDAPNEASYRLQRSEREDTTWGAWAQVAVLPGDSTTYADTISTLGDSFRYRVRACSAAGCSGWSDAVRVTAGSAPGAPAIGLPWIPVGGRIVLSWIATGATHFTVQRRAIDDASGTWSTIAEPSVTNVTDSTVVIGSAYRYRVRACNGVGCSGWALSAEVTATPVGSMMAFNVVWWIEEGMVLEPLMGSGAAWWQAQRQTWDAGTSSWRRWQTVVDSATAMSYDDWTVRPSTTYRYRVRGCAPEGCGPWMMSGDRTTDPMTRPAPPFAVSPTNEGSGVIDVHISYIHTAWYYAVDRAERVGGVWSAWAPLESVDGASDMPFYHDEAVGTGVLYRYRVRACNGAGCSSAAVSPSVREGPLYTPEIWVHDWPVLGISADGSMETVEIERRAWNGTSDAWEAWIPLAVLPASVTEYEDSTAPPVNLHYRARACAAGRCSSWMDLYVE